MADERCGAGAIHSATYIQNQQADEINFAWQGGRADAFGSELFSPGGGVSAEIRRERKKISNALQTNGTLLDDEWCEFLASHKFLVGLSIDGPEVLHDFYRVDKSQKPTFGFVMRGLRLLAKHEVDFNTLTVVNRMNSKKPAEVYRFLKEIGSRFMQFIPVVERARGELSLRINGMEIRPSRPHRSWGMSRVRASN